MFICNIMYNKNNTKILGTISNGEIREWDIIKKKLSLLYQSNNTKEQNYLLPKFAIYNLDNTKILTAGTMSNKIYEIDIKSNNIINIYEGHKEYITCANYSFNGTSIISSSDFNIREWNTISCKCVNSIILNINSLIYKFSYSQNSKKIIVISQTGDIKEFCFHNGKFIRDIINNKVVLDAIYNNQGNKILYTVEYEFLREVNSEDLEITFEIYGCWACATYNNCCNQIFSINLSNGNVYQWDIATSKVINIYESNNNCYATSICISNNNKKICIGYKDYTKIKEEYFIKEWDTETGKPINSF